MNTTQPSAHQQARLDHLSTLAKEVREAQEGLEQAIRTEIAQAGLRPLWVAQAVGMARSTIYLILSRGGQ